MAEVPDANKGRVIGRRPRHKQFQWLITNQLNDRRLTPAILRLHGADFSASSSRDLAGVFIDSTLLRALLGDQALIADAADSTIEKIIGGNFMRLFREVAGNGN